MAMKVVKPVYGEGCTLLNDEEVIAAIVSNSGFHNVNIKILLRYRIKSIGLKYMTSAS